MRPPLRAPGLRWIVRMAMWVAAASYGAAGAQPGAALGLLEAYVAARANDPVFRAAIADQQAGQQFEAIGRASLLPSVSAVLSTARNSAVVGAADGSREDRGDYTSSTRSIQLRQPIVNAEGWAARRQGIARAAEAQAQFRHREQELIVRVVDAYSQALLAQEEVQLVRAQLEALEALLQANEQRLRAGEGTRTEILETSAKRALVRARLVEAQDAHANRLVALRVLVGVPFDRVQALRTDAAARAEVPGTLQEWRRRAHAASAELERLRQSITVAREEIRRLESGHLPRLDLLLSAGRSTSETTATFQQTSATRTVGLQLIVPIYSGGAITAQARQAAALLERAQAELDIRRAELDVELHRQFGALEHGALRHDALREAVAAGEALVTATQRSVAGGERTNVDVIDARERLAQARRDLARAGYEQLMAMLRLRLLAGELDEVQLRTLAAHLVAG